MAYGSDPDPWSTRSAPNRLPRAATRTSHTANGRAAQTLLALIADRPRPAPDPRHELSAATEDARRVRPPGRADGRPHLASIRGTTHPAVQPRTPTRSRCSQGAHGGDAGPISSDTNTPSRATRDATAQLKLVRRYAKLLRESAAATSVRRAGHPRPPVRPSTREHEQA